MKKKIKTILKIAGIIAFAAVIGFALTGCDELEGDPDDLKMPLNTPANVRVEHSNYTEFTLKWDTVQGADSYLLNIDDKLTQVSSSTTSYDLRALTADPKVYPIRVKAIARNGDPLHSDSLYSTTLNVEPAEFIFIVEDNLGPSPSIQMGRNIVQTSSGSGTIAGLTTYGRTLERVVIPPAIGSTTIAAIGDNAFGGNALITAISLPETITNIGSGAFSGTNITSIVIPEAVVTIGDGAFSNITVLAVVVFVSVEPPNLGEGVFDGSDAIESIVVPEGGETAYTEMIVEKAPDLVEIIEEVTVEKLLVSIEVAQLPKINYIVGEHFNADGMIVNARYSDNTFAAIQNYSVLLRATGGSGTGSGAGSTEEFVPANRALNANDTVVRLSYTENGITKIANINISVTLPSTFFTVTFNAGQGGWAGISGNTISVQVEAGKTVNSSQVPNPIRQGYNFDGWVSLLTTGTTTTEVPFNFNTQINSNMSITAKWSSSGTGPGPTTYTVTFNAGDGIFPAVPGNPVGTNKIITVQVEAGKTVTPPSVVPFLQQPQGFVFNYWRLGNFAFDFDTPINNNITLLPEWKSETTGPNPTTFTVTFDAGDGFFLIAGHPDGGTKTMTVQVEAGRSVTPPSANPVNSGYNFSYWRQFNQPFNFDTSINSDITLIAEWTNSGSGGNNFIVTVNQRTGGTITLSPVVTGNTYAPGTTVTINVTPDQGYQLQSLSVTIGTTSINHHPNSDGGFTFSMPAGNVMVNGVFIQTGGGTDPGNPTFFTVTFNAGQGSWEGASGGNIRNVQVEAGQTVRSSEVPPPTRQGFNFDGWVSYSTEIIDGETTSVEIPFSFDTPIYSNMQLTAKWTNSGSGGNNFIVTVNQRTGGTITLSPVVTGNTYAAGTTVTINVDIDQGYQMQSLSVTIGTNSINYQTNSDGGFFFTMPAGNVMVNGMFIQTGGGTGQSYIINTGNIGGGTITTNPSASAVEGTTVHIYANPNSGYTFNVTSLLVMNNTTNTPINWQYTAGTLSDYHFIMPASDVTISGEFTVVTSPTSHIITVNQRPGGTITLSPVSTGNSYAAGTTVTINVTPDQGYQLQNLIVISGSNSINYQQNTSGGYFFIMPASDVMINGVFEQSTSGNYTVTVVERPNGTVTLSPVSTGNSYAVGTTVTINVTPDQDYQLQNLIVTSGTNSINYQSSADGGFFFTMPASNVMINAVFEQATSGASYTITVNQRNGGTLSTNPTNTGSVFPAGTSITINVSPDYGYYLQSLTVMNTTNNQPISHQLNPSSNSYFFTMPAGNVMINPVFEPIDGGSTQLYNITTNISTLGGGAGTVGGTITAGQGSYANEIVSFTVTPYSGYQLVSLRVMNGTNNTQINHQQTADFYLFTMPEGHVTIFAEFSTTSGTTGQ